MTAEVNDSMKLIAKTDIQCRNASDGHGGRIEDGGIRVSIEGVVSTRGLVEIDDMKAVFTVRACFDAIELDGIVCVQMEVEALEKEGGVHAIWGDEDA